MNGEKSSNLRLFRKQLIFWGGLAAIALAFFVYGAYGQTGGGRPQNHDFFHVS